MLAVLRSLVTPPGWESLEQVVPASHQQPPASRQKNCVRVTAAPRSPAHRARELCNQRAVRRAPCTAGWMMWPAFRLGNIFPTFNISQHTAQNTTPRCVDTMGIDFINIHRTISRIIKYFYFFTITNPAFISHIYSRTMMNTKTYFSMTRKKSFK